ncbi:nucleoside-diphosphate-sugar pyrophosphorylase [Candidatus Aerophobetes bacterium]|uniref:Nucleoside-diphosphate-sugar pyrophosphorylase n=1 Tax=Aerophobetes bacterium TaxID=2030807 RepID=A0A523S1M4_UNCAE|nr:MAG: nucleoside-diphosphate-sugar pyrophosphorylase [Candidatus Aerophobetes bacterium]
MQSLILTGGLGTRLRKTIGNRPKPMVLIRGRPFLEYLLWQLKKYRLEEVVLCTGYLGTQIKEYFGDGQKWGVSIRYSQERIPLGTGGAIKLAENLVRGDTLLVMNGDSFLNIALDELIEYHYHKKALATLALVEVKNAGAYGVVEIDKKGRILNFLEKSGGSSSRLINGGVYVFDRKLMDLIPPGKRVSIEEEIFPRLVGNDFFGMPKKVYFIDIGIPENLKRAQRELEEKLAVNS